MANAADLLGRVTQSLPGGGESRPGQVEMALGVAEALAGERALLVEAGTGTGKSLAYLTPIVDSDRQAVVATATIALQTQLVETDLPLVAKALDRNVTVALLKGRRNYLCRQRLAELERAQRSEQLQLLGGRNPDHHLERVVDWAAVTIEGDREELDPTPPSEVWTAVSVGADECPGAKRCPSGDQCFSEQARQRAMAADVIVTNHHYYGLNIASGGVLLPEHDIVVFDEAHQLPEVLGATCGTELGGGRFRALARRVRSVLTDDQLSAALDQSAADIEELLRPALGKSLTELGDLVGVVVTGRDRAERIISELRKLDPGEGTDIAARIERTMLVASRLVNDIDAILQAADSDVLWVDGNTTSPVLRRTPLELQELLEANLWEARAVVLTSATLSDGIVGQLGLGPEQTVLRVGSPFDYSTAGMLYCPVDLPSPKSKDHRAAVQDEIIALVEAAGGRALCLFTSFSAMTEAAERFETEVANPVLVQGEASKSALIDRFKGDPTAILLATLSFWQGIDLPGSTLTLVTIDRLPFPRPDEPVAQARRDRAGKMAFREVDLPRAQTLLAQAAGRLIRRADDRGVVAVLDPRLATNRSYRWDLIQALPPFRRTKDRAEVVAFLAELDRANPVGPDLVP
ncbi:MAG: ATP-dependent DNA helicase [Acidimicrobiales bacterium]